MGNIASEFIRDPVILEIPFVDLGLAIGLIGEDHVQWYRAEGHRGAEVAIPIDIR